MIVRHIDGREGEVTEWNDVYFWVRFGLNNRAELCLPEELQHDPLHPQRGRQGLRQGAQHRQGRQVHTTTEATITQEEGHQDMTKDPLVSATPLTGREAFDAVKKVLDGAPRDVVHDAAINLIINSMRQQHPSRAAAFAAYDELFGRAKQILSDHYDVQGRKRGLFPYNQEIKMDLFRAENKFPHG